jgi:hypothetical protein
VITRLAIHDDACRIQAVDFSCIPNLGAVFWAVVDGHRVFAAGIHRIGSTLDNLGILEYRVCVFGTGSDDACTILTKCIRIFCLAILAFHSALAVIVDAA